jgi:peptidoglycan L-alanyl-D-glutamate endopeptidase CwlK
VTRAAATARQQGLARAGEVVGTAGSESARWVRANARWIALAVAVLAAPPMLALALRGWQELGSFDHTASREINEQVATLLRGEQLVPPPRCRRSFS